MERLNDIIRREEKSLKIFNRVGLLSTVVGYGLRSYKQLGVLSSNWFSEHLLELGITMLLTSYAMEVTQDRNKYIQAIAAAIPAAGCTAHEFFPLINGENKFDYPDVIMFWSAALLTYGITKLSSSENARSFFSRISQLRYENPFI